MDNEIREFYNNYGMREWERLECDAYARINYLLHNHFIESELIEGTKVLDAGCGAGRFSIEFAKRGCRVTLFDISDDQLRIAEQKIEEASVGNQIDGICQGNIRDLSMFEDNSFDLVVCYGAPLSYIMDGRETAMAEMVRVTKERGTVVVSVNNRWGILKTLLGTNYPHFFDKPDYWFIKQVMNTGDLPRHEKVDQPPRHFFDAEELEFLLSQSGLKNIALGGSPCFSCGNINAVNEMSKNKKAFKTIIDIELKTYCKRSMVDNGEFLLAKGVK